MDFNELCNDIKGSNCSENVSKGCGNYDVKSSCSEPSNNNYCQSNVGGSYNINNNNSHHAMNNNYCGLNGNYGGYANGCGYGKGYNNFVTLLLLFLICGGVGNGDCGCNRGFFW